MERGRRSTLEVALRITPAQLEEVTERHAGRPVDLDAEGSDDADRRVAADRIRRHSRRRRSGRRAAFPRIGSGRKPAKLKWVGKEVGISVAWVYFEVPLPGGWAGATVADRVRLNAEPAQHNTLVLSVTRPGPDGRPEKLRAAYTFDRRTPARVLRPADLKPLKKRPAAAG